MSAALPLPVLLLGTGCLLLAALGLSGAFLLRGIDLGRREAARIARVVAPLNRGKALPSPNLARLGGLAEGGPLGWLGWVFGFDASRRGRYPLPWWLVLAVGFVLGRMAMPFAVAFVGGAGFAVLPAVWIGGSRFYFRTVDAGVRNRLLTQFPDALATLVRTVRVGIPVAEAVRAVAEESQAPTASEFAALHGEILIGVPLDQALRAMAERTGLAEYRFFATAIALQAQTGGGLTEVMENLADVIRRRIALQARGRALSAEARASAAVLAVMPAFTGGMIWMLNPGYMDTLFDAPVGHTLLGVAAASLATGIIVMRAIIRKALA